MMQAAISDDDPIKKAYQQIAAQVALAITA